MEFPAEITGSVAVAGFGTPPKPDFWINKGTPQKPHVQVGGTANGAPGPRPHYHPGSYGAFVLDPDGHNIEVVCHKP